MMKLRSVFHAFTAARMFAGCLAATVLLVSPGLAGEIFGTIKADGKVVPKGLKLEVATPAKIYTTETDNFGSYRLYVAEKGKCALTVHYREKAPLIQIYSYPKSTRYDFVIEQKDTVYVLKRK
jgi:hypothetical protein